MNAQVGHRIQPVHGLLVKIGQTGVTEAGPEVDPHVMHTCFDLALGLRPIRLAGAGREAIIGGEVQILGMPVHDVRFIPTQHRCFQIVVQHFARHAAQVVKAVHVAAQPPGHVGRDGELQVHGPRPTECHKKGIQSSLAALMLDGAEAGPIDLGLLARFCFEAHRGGERPRRAQGCHKVTDVSLAALVALCLDLVVQLTGVDHAFVDAFTKVLNIRAEAASPAGPRRTNWHQRFSQHLPHRLAVTASAPGDFADGGLLLAQFLDHEPFLHSEHGWTS